MMPIDQLSEKSFLSPWKKEERIDKTKRLVAMLIKLGGKKTFKVKTRWIKVNSSSSSFFLNDAHFFKGKNETKDKLFRLSKHWLKRKNKFTVRKIWIERKKQKENVHD